MSSRQMPVGSAAVRALSSFGNGSLLSSRSSTPTLSNQFIGSATMLSADGTSILDRKLGKIVADRQNALRQELYPPIKSEDDSKRMTAVTNEQVKSLLNGKVDAEWQQQMQLEDQEVSSLISSALLNY